MIFQRNPCLFIALAVAVFCRLDVPKTEAKLHDPTSKKNNVDFWHAMKDPETGRKLEADFAELNQESGSVNCHRKVDECDRHDDCDDTCQVRNLLCICLECLISCSILSMFDTNLHLTFVCVEL